MSKAKYIQLDMFATQESSISKEEVLKMLVTDNEQQIRDALDLAAKNGIQLHRELTIIEIIASRYWQYGIVDEYIINNIEDKYYLVIKMLQFIYNPPRMGFIVTINMNEAANNDYMYICNMFFTNCTQISIYTNQIPSGKTPTELAQRIADFVNKCHKQNYLSIGCLSSYDNSPFMKELIVPLINNQESIKRAEK